MHNTNQYSSYLFFCCYIVVGIWFFLNLLLGVIFLSFSTEEKKILKKNLTENQAKWIEIVKTLANIEPLGYSIPQRGLKRQIFNLINGVYFQFLIMISLILNVAFLLMYYDNQPKELTQITTFFYVLIWSLYFSEMVLKCFSYGFFPYLSQYQNKIEALIVVCNCIYMVFLNLPLKTLIVDNYSRLCIMKLLNFLRLTILLRIIRKIKSIENLYNSLKFAFPLLFHLILLLLLTLFIYSLIGCLFFNSVNQGNIVNEYINFKNVFYGMMTLFKCVTCDNWADIMLDFSKTQPNCKENIDCGSSK